MDRITKVKEVSSFILNFDHLYWNEVILRLTLIGIRYVTNKYQNAFNWDLRDLNMILERLKRKEQKNNYKDNFNNKKISKKLNNISLLSDRTYPRNNNINNKKIKKSKGNDIFFKNKRNWNRKISLKHNLGKENNKKNNFEKNNFPLIQRININEPDETELDNNEFENNDNNFDFDFNDEKNDYVKINKFRNNEINSSSYTTSNENNSFEEYDSKYSNEDYSQRKTNRLLIDNSFKKYDYKNSSKEFMCELRRLSQNKDNKQNFRKKLVSNIINRSKSKLDTTYSYDLKDNKKIPKKLYYRNNSAFTSRENINKIKSDISNINKEYDKKITENNLSKNIKGKYHYKNNDNLRINFNYELNDSYENKQEKNNTNLEINKYLRNPNYNSKKRYLKYIQDGKRKNKNDDYLEYFLNNENIYSNIDFNNNAHKKDSYYFHDLYEI